jgi:uncharacterized protein YraI
MKNLLVPFLAALALALPLAADAQQVAYAAYRLDLRAGPDVRYPVVVVLPPGTQVVVQGCLNDWRWCDVSYGPERGWVDAGTLRYAAQQGYLPLPQVAPALGIGIIGFGIHDYWGSHYRDRPWYGQRDRWDRTDPRHRPQPRPGVRPQDDRSGPGLGIAPSVPRDSSGWDPRNPDAPRPDKP